MLSTMRRVPFEIMGEIFQYYISPGGEEPDAQHPSRPSNPMLLCLVCQHWKIIAMATPTLWTNITLKANEQHLGGLPQIDSSQAAGIMAWMDRTSSHPWTLTVDSSNKTVCSARAKNTVLLSQLLLRPASQHIRRLSISADPFSVGMGHITLSRVTSAVIRCGTWPAHPNPTLPDLPSLPNLTHAFFANISMKKYTPSQIPWSQLTHLFIDGDMTMDMRQWRALFKHCTSLQKGCFRLFYDFNNEMTYPEPAEVTLSYLTDLTFLGESPFEDPIDGLSLPSLTKLRLYTTWNHLEWDFTNPDLYSNLTHLTLISHAPATEEEYVGIFDTCPQLTELFFLVSRDFEEVCGYLTFGEGNINLPYLKALGIYLETYRYRPEHRVREHDGDREDVRPFPYHAFMELATSRTQAVQRGDFSALHSGIASLEHLVLRLDSHSNWADEIAAKLVEEVDPKLFMEHGLRVSVVGEWVGLNHLPVRPSHRQPRYLEHLGGDAPPVLARCYKHWDEGFGDFIDEIEEYSLYAKSSTGCMASDL